MSDEWFKTRNDLPDDPDLIRAAELCGIDQDLMLGKVIRFWAWVDKHCKNGNAFVTLNWLQKYLNVTGIGDALMKVGWLEVDDDGLIIVPKFDEHFSENAKMRAKTAKRVKKHRQKCNAARVTKRVTKALPEEEEEEENNKNPPTPLIEKISFPESLRSQACRDAIEEWIAYRREIGKPLKSAKSPHEILNRFADAGETRLIEAVRFSIAQGYVGVFPDDGRTGQTGQGGSSSRPSARGGSGNHTSGRVHAEPGKYDRFKTSSPQVGPTEAKD